MAAKRVVLELPALKNVLLYDKNVLFSTCKKHIILPHKQYAAQTLSVSHPLHEDVSSLWFPLELAFVMYLSSIRRDLIEREA